jgi:hypothetical protein
VPASAWWSGRRKRFVGIAVRLLRGTRVAGASGSGCPFFIRPTPPTIGLAARLLLGRIAHPLPDQSGVSSPLSRRRKTVTRWHLHSAVTSSIVISLLGSGGAGRNRVSSRKASYLRIALLARDTCSATSTRKLTGSPSSTISPMSTRCLVIINI